MTGQLARILASATMCVVLNCSSYRDALSRGQRHYEDNQYERALAVWRQLDERQYELGPADYARYAYLRGMTDYRLGFRSDARHWLAIAKATAQKHPGSLDDLWLTRLNGALRDLDREVFGVSVDVEDPVQTIEVRPSDLARPKPPLDAEPTAEPPDLANVTPADAG